MLVLFICRKERLGLGLNVLEIISFKCIWIWMFWVLFLSGLNIFCVFFCLKWDEVYKIIIGNFFKVGRE